MSYNKETHMPDALRADDHGEYILYDSPLVGGDEVFANIRGWGFLTGQGHGGCGLSDDEAFKFQCARGRERVKRWNEHVAMKARIEETNKTIDILVNAFNGHKPPDNYPFACKLFVQKEQIRSMVQLLIECRDALPAISMVSARLHNVDLKLADRIEQVLEPWRIK